MSTKLHNDLIKNSPTVSFSTYGGSVSNTGAENRDLLIKLIQENPESTIRIDGPSGSVYDFEKVAVTQNYVSLEIAEGITVRGDALVDDSEQVFDFTVLSGQLFGKGTIDCNDKYGAGIRFINTANSSDGLIVIKDVSIVNVFKSLTPSGQANAITVTGGFDHTYIDNVYINKVRCDGPDTVLNGAIARGIVVRYLSDNDLVSKRTTVINSHIEDLAPAGEADGIFVQESPFFFYDDTSLHVENNTFINCEKRAVKSQVSRVVMINNRVEKNRPYTLSDLGSGSFFGTDFDAQYGNGIISNNYSYYTSGNYAPSSFAVVSSKNTLEKNAAVSSAGLKAHSSYITNNRIKCEDAVVRDTATFAIIQNRVAPDESYIANIDDVYIQNNSCDISYVRFVLGFIIAESTTANAQIKNLIAENNRVQDLTDNYIFDFLRSSSSPTGNNSLAANIYVRNFEIKNKSLIQTADDSAFSDASLSYDVQNAVDTKFAGGVNQDTQVGEALNTDIIEFDILRPANSTVKVKANFNRETNNSNDRVQCVSEFYLTESELGGRRHIKKVYEENTAQAGEWEIVGDIARVDSVAGALPLQLRRTTIRKTAGVTTDSYGASQGNYSIEVEGTDVAIVPKDATTGVPVGTTTIVESPNPGYFEVIAVGSFQPTASGVTQLVNNSPKASDPVFEATGTYRIDFSENIGASYQVFLSQGDHIGASSVTVDYAKFASSLKIYVRDANNVPVSSPLPLDISYYIVKTF